MKILVVDDSAGDRKQNARLLSEAFPGCNIENALGPRQALKKCAEIKFDLVTIDGDLGYQEDSGRGDDLVREIGELYPGMPMVMITNDLSVVGRGVWAIIDKCKISSCNYRAKAIEKLRSAVSL